MRAHHYLRRTIALTAAGLLAGAGIVVGTATAASAAGKPLPGKDVCAHLVSAADLSRGAGTTTATTTQTDIAAAARYKEEHDTEAAELRSLNAAYAEHNARKQAEPLPARSATAKRCGSASAAAAAVAPAFTSGPGYGYISWMYQYGQVTNYFCGPATVSAMSATVPGTSPYNLSQWDVATYMGTTTGGTSSGGMVNGLNHYVGVPDFGRNFYGYVAMAYIPTAAQRATFLQNLQADVAVDSPVAGGGWEVPGYEHLVGHPVNQEIKHWFEIGGWNTTTSKIWYADPATTVWSSVPPYSWMDMNSLETILGGYGYIW